MAIRSLTSDELRAMLVKNWMTHDALWYGEAAKKFGMKEASPMNLRVCRKLGQIECKRLMKIVGASTPKDLNEFREIFALGEDAFIPDFMTYKIEYPGENRMLFHAIDCFAHRGMKQTGMLPDYECGIFERIEGWFDAIGVKYTKTPDLSRCLKLKGEECLVTVEFDFD